MKLFELIEVRAVDPVDLANRAGKIYGKEKDYGYYDSDTIPGDYIPLKNYDEAWVEEMHDVFHEIYKTFDFYNKPREEQNQIVQKLHNETKTIKSLPINKLKATQQFVRIDDRELLKQKVSSAKDIIVVSFASRLFIKDGHHAVLAARLRGEKQINAQVVDLDYLEEKYL